MTEREPGATRDWRDVLAWFDRWADAPDAASREAVLADLQAVQPALVPRLQAMIAADAQAHEAGFLDAPAVLPTAPAEPAALEGRRIGAWTLQSLIGAGGMGQVWRAERSDGQHRGIAAVKLLHAARSDALARARFVREGELLALLTHPHIAQLLDAGEADDGTRYLVLEHVQGERIDTWCDARRLGLRERLGLFVQVCEAVAWAHAHLVVHRDIKPGNILVTDAGHVKLLDFGVAKLLEEDAAELTHLGAAGLTPEYAAPEQIEGGAISTATDVYALGVLLYRLLGGGRPYGSTRSSPAQMAREILEAEPRRLGHVDIDAEAAGARGTTPARLQQALRGDLEAIVAKALRKKPAERYGGVAALRDDVQRHLAHEPVSARPDSLGYRVSSYVRRHRIQVAAFGAVLIAVLAGSAVATWQWREAVRETRRTQAALTVLTELFAGLTPDAQGSAQVPVVELLRRGWAQVRNDLRADPALQAEVAHTLGMMLKTSGDMTPAVEALSVTREQWRDQGRQRSAEYLQVVQELGFALAWLSRHAEARAAFEEVIAVAATMSPAGDETALLARIQLALLDRAAGRLDAAHERLDGVIAIARRQPGKQAQVLRSALQEQADVARERGQWDEARTLLAEAAQHPEGGHEAQVSARMNQVVLEFDMGRFGQAAALLEPLSADIDRLFGPDQASAINARLWLSMAWFHHGDTVQADRRMAEAGERAARARDAEQRFEVQLVQARQLLRRGAVAQAEPLLRATLAHYDDGSPPHRPYAERARALLAEALLRRGQAGEALALATQARSAQRGLYAAPHLDLWPTLMLVALARDAAQGPHAALADYAAAHELAHRLLPEGHPDRARAAWLVAQAQWRDTRSDAARAALVQAADALRDAWRARADAASLLPRPHALLALGPAARVEDLWPLINP